MIAQAISRKSFFVTTLAALFSMMVMLPDRVLGDTEKKHSPKWEFWTGSIADFTLNFESKVLSGGFLGDRSTISPSIGYFVSDQIEILLAPSFNFHTSGNYFGRILGGVCGNFFGDTIASSYYGKLLIGFDDILDNRRSDAIHFTLKTFTWSAAVGKRFELNPYVSFAPEVSFMMIFEEFSSINSLSFIPLQFTFSL